MEMIELKGIGTLFIFASFLYLLTKPHKNMNDCMWGDDKTQTELLVDIAEEKFKRTSPEMFPRVVDGCRFNSIPSLLEGVLKIRNKSIYSLCETTEQGDFNRFKCLLCEQGQPMYFLYLKYYPTSSALTSRATIELRNGTHAIGIEVYNSKPDETRLKIQEMFSNWKNYLDKYKENPQ